MITKEELLSQIVHTAELARTANPMAGSITNTVTIDFVANAQLAVGGSAAMVYLPDEGEFLACAGGALYINVGTLLPIYEQSVPRAALKAHQEGIPWVLDPVAIGIGSLRTKLLLAVKDAKPTIIRGNASEIIALARLWDTENATQASVDATSSSDGQQGRGVDSTDSVEAARMAAVTLARFTGGAVAVSGQIDLVTDGTVVVRSMGGSSFMESITGSGCSLGGVCAVYAAVAPTPLAAALTAVNVYNLAGRNAGDATEAPASFKVAFLDELYKATPQSIAENPFTVEEA